MSGRKIEEKLSRGKLVISHPGEGGTEMGKLKVLLTGAAGWIGSALVKPFRERYVLRTFDRRPVPGDPAAVVGDLGDLDLLKTAMEGVDVLVHLAATPGERPFVENLVPSNIVGAYNALQAAHEAGVRRVVFASSAQTVQGYPRDMTVEVTDPVRPASIYGATKVFGEALGRFYHDHHGMEFVALRLGWCLPHDDEKMKTPEAHYVWLSPKDRLTLFQRAIEKPGIGYAIVFGTSITEREFLSRAPARELLDFEPEDDVVAVCGPALKPVQGTE